MEVDLYGKAAKTLTKAAQDAGCLVKTEVDKKLTTIIGKLELAEDFKKMLALTMATKYAGIGIPGISSYDKTLYEAAVANIETAFKHNVYLVIDGAKETMSIAIFTHSAYIAGELYTQSTALIANVDLNLQARRQYLSGNFISLDLKTGLEDFTKKALSFAAQGQPLETAVWATEETMQRLAYLNELNALADTMREKYLMGPSRLKIPPYLVEKFGELQGKPSFMGLDDKVDVSKLTIKKAPSIIKTTMGLLKK